MEFSRVSQDTALTQQRQPSKKSKIIMLLAQLGIRRQAKLDKEDYQVFAADLEKYELSDLEVAMKAISSKPRAEGETAFPEVATIEEAVRAVIRSRRPSEDEWGDSGAKWLAYVAAYKAEGHSDAPDEETQKLIAKLNEKMGVTR